MNKLERSINRAFKKHVADFTETTINGRKMWVLDWAEPNTTNMAIKYIYANRTLMISGDLGEASYVWGNFVQLQAFLGFGEHYFFSKLRAFSEKKYSYDADKAAKELTRQFRDHEWFKHDGFSREEAKELLDEVISIYQE